MTTNSTHSVTILLKHYTFMRLVTMQWVWIGNRTFHSYNTQLQVIITVSLIYTPTISI
jgi:hypothetical protein